MNTIHITTSQNIEIEYDLASIGERIFGYIIDFFIIVAYVIILLFVLNFGASFRLITENYFVSFLLSIPIVFYDLISELLLNGQSAGKKVMGIKVISLTGEQPALSQYLIRWLFRLIDFTFSSGMLGIIMVAVTEKKQRLGDLIAGTALIKTKPRVRLEDTLYIPTGANDYKVIYPEVINLKDSDVQLVKEIIVAVRRSGNMMLAVQAQEKIEAVLHIRSQHQDSVHFLQVILADYNYLTGMH